MELNDLLALKQRCSSDKLNKWSSIERRNKQANKGQKKKRKLAHDRWTTRNSCQFKHQVVDIGTFNPRLEHCKVSPTRFANNTKNEKKNQYERKGWVENRTARTEAEWEAGRRGWAVAREPCLRSGLSSCCFRTSKRRKDEGRGDILVRKAFSPVYSGEGKKRGAGDAFIYLLLLYFHPINSELIPEIDNIFLWFIH